MKRLTPARPRFARSAAAALLLVVVVFVFAGVADEPTPTEPAPSESAASETLPAEEAPAKSAEQEAAEQDVAEPPAEELVLARFGIEPTAESLGDYLEALHPNAETKQRTAELIAGLASEDFPARERAMRELLRMPTPDSAQLEQAVSHGDPETRWRSGQVLGDLARRREEILYAVFKTIARREVRGLTKPLLAALPLVTERYLASQARASLAATAVNKDAPLLREQLTDPAPAMRIAALSSLETLARREAKSDDASDDGIAIPSGVFTSTDAQTYDVAAFAGQLLTDDDDQVRVTAAKTLANFGRRESLVAFLALLDSEQLEVRVDAARALRSLTDQTFPFTAYESAAVRREQTVKWRQWVEASGRTAALTFPLRQVAYELGRTLVCNHGSATLFEYDASHKEVWQKSVGPEPWCCQGLPNGHRLVASYNNKDVVEYDAAGKEVWKAEGLPGGPTSVERLDNGHTLIACTDSSRVVEVDTRGKIVWEITIEGRPVEAQRLDNGRTLVVLQNAGRVVEVDRKGTVVWELTDAASTFSAQRLENGNTLVCMMHTGEVCEFDPERNKVWSYGGLSTPYDVQRTAAGTTLIVDSSGVLEVDRQKKVIWRLSMSSVSRAYRY